MKKYLLTIALGLACGYSAMAQANISMLRIPARSPHAGVFQEIGNTDIKIYYSRPALNGRDPFADLSLVPKDGKPMPWRAGADENTTLSISTPVKIGDKIVAAGKYGLHVIVKDAPTWTVILSKNNRAWGSFSYSSADDAARFEAEVLPVAQSTENLVYSFSDITNNSTVVNLNWANKQMRFKIEVDLFATVVPDLNEQLTGREAFGWAGFDAAARWSLRSNIALDTALIWAENSIINYRNIANLSTKAALLTKLGKTKEAEVVENEIMEEANADEFLQLVANNYQINKTKAKAYLDQATKKYPTKWQTFNAWGYWYRMEKDLPKALEYYKKAQAAAPTDIKSGYDLRIKGLEEQVNKK